MSFKEVVNIMETRTEYDSMGPVEVDARRIYGPQTLRSVTTASLLNKSKRLRLSKKHVL